MRNVVKAKKKCINQKILFFLLNIFSIIVSLVLMLFYNDATYYLNCMLPIGYILGNMLSVGLLSKYLLKNRVITIITIGYFIKMVITPLCFALGGFNSFFNGYLLINNNNEAVLFMIYEYICIMTMISLFSNLRINKMFSLSNNILSLKKLKLIVIILFIFLCGIYIYIKEIRTIYYFILNINFKELVNIRWDNEVIVARGSYKRYLYSLFMLLFPIIRYILPIVLIYENFIKRGITKKGLFISSLYVFIPFVLVGGDNLGPFIASIYTLVVIAKLYGKKGRKIIYIFLTGGFIGILSMVIEKLVALKNWRGSSGITNFSQLLNAYFPGFDNISIAMKMEGTQKISTLFFDIYSGIPFIGSIYNLKGKTLNDLYVEFSNTGGQIVPWGANIGYYTTFILSPLFTGIVVLFILSLEKKSEKTTIFWKYYIYMFFSVYTAISIIIYSTQIYLRFIWNVFIPIYILLKISKSFKSKR